MKEKDRVRRRAWVRTRLTNIIGTEPRKDLARLLIYYVLGKLNDDDLEEELIRTKNRIKRGTVHYETDDEFYKELAAIRKRLSVRKGEQWQ